MKTTLKMNLKQEIYFLSTSALFVQIGYICVIAEQHTAQSPRAREWEVNVVVAGVQGRGTESLVGSLRAAQRCPSRCLTC